ncbi:MAG TPA: type II toxin-antitoxin system RelE/ParE family toxin [Gemmatimonadaceae bacterium]
MPDPTYLEFVHLPTYRRSAESLIDDNGQREIEDTLLANPKAGPVIAGTGGVRKLRIALQGRGKQGGGRMIYYYREAKGRIYLIVAYGKGRKDDLTASERAVMKRLTAAIESES